METTQKDEPLSRIPRKKMSHFVVVKDKKVPPLPQSKRIRAKGAKMGSFLLPDVRGVFCADSGGANQRAGKAAD